MVKRYRNGHIDIKLEQAVIREFRLQHITERDVMAQVLNELIDVDCYIIGEPYSMGNFDLAYSLYCAYNGFVYVLTGNEVHRLTKGYLVKMYNRKPTEDELILINNM